MEEKKLTDEEIVKALKVVGKETLAFAYDKEQRRFKYVTAKEILDLIHRLQADKAELKEDVEHWEAIYKISEERKYRKMFNEEWKKEYQKELDKQGEGLIAGSPDFDYVYELYFKQKTEIERLTEENAHLTKLNEEKRLEEFNFSKKIVTQNAELQKQVDELTLKAKNVVQGNRPAITNFEREMVNLYNAETNSLIENIKQQSVKDTAKEIYSEINSCIEKGQEYCGTDWRGLLTAKTIILVWCKKHGVEVE